MNAGGLACFLRCIHAAEHKNLSQPGNSFEGHWIHGMHMHGFEIYVPDILAAARRGGAQCPSKRHVHISTSELAA